MGYIGKPQSADPITVNTSNITDGSIQAVDISSSFREAISGSFNDASASFSTRVTTAESELSNTLISSSAQIADDISGSFTAASSSFSTRTTTLEGASATTGSNSFNGNQTVTGSLTVTETIIAQEFKTEFVSASITFTSGSTKFGDTADDIHQMTGSLRVTGSGNHYFQTGNVGIGTTSPDDKLHVHTATAGNVTAHTQADEIVIESNTTAGMSILTPDVNSALIRFGSPGSNNYAAISSNYGAGTPTMEFSILDSNKLMIKGSNVGVGVTPETDWRSNVVGLQVGAGGSIFARSDSGETKIFIAENVKWNDTGYQRINSGSSAMHYMDGGAHNFAVGGIDNADTTISFTNALILSNAGKATFADNVRIPNSKKLVLNGTDEDWYLGVDSSYNIVLNGGGAGSRAFVIKDHNDSNAERLNLNLDTGNATFAGNVGIGIAPASNKQLRIQGVDNSFHLDIVGGTDGRNFQIYDEWTGGDNKLVLQAGGNSCHMLITAGTADQLLIQNDGSVTTAGNFSVGGTASYQKFTLLGGNMYIQAGYDITWANGNAVIGESGYALEFDTYTGSALTRALTLAGDNTATFAGAVEMDAGSFVDNSSHKGYKVTNGSDGNGYLWAKYMHVANGAGATKLCQAYDYQAFLVSVTHDGGNGSALDYVWIDSANGAPTVNNIVESGTVPTRTYTRGDGWAMTYITLGDSGLGAHKVQCMKLGGY